VETFATLGNEIAAFGGPDWTNSSAVGQNDGKFGKLSNRTSVKGFYILLFKKKKKKKKR
jgi:hypothetical protein